MHNKDLQLRCKGSKNATTWIRIRNAQRYGKGVRTARSAQRPCSCSGTGPSRLEVSLEVRSSSSQAAGEGEVRFQLAAQVKGHQGKRTEEARATENDHSFADAVILGCEVDVPHAAHGNQARKQHPHRQTVQHALDVDVGLVDPESDRRAGRERERVRQRGEDLRDVRDPVGGEVSMQSAREVGRPDSAGDGTADGAANLRDGQENGSRDGDV